MLPDCRWYASRVAVVSVGQHIIQRMIVRFLSQSVDDGVIFGVAVDAIGGVSPAGMTACRSSRLWSRNLCVPTSGASFGISYI